VLIASPSNMYSYVTDETAARNACTIANDTDCRGYYQITIDPLQQCMLTGQYIIAVTPSCRDPTPPECDTSKIGQTINITANLQSEDFCSQFQVNVGLSATINSYTDSTFTTQNNGFYAAGSVYFKASATTDAGSDAITSTAILGVSLINQNNLSNIYVLVDPTNNGAVTAIGTKIGYKTYPGQSTWVGFSYLLNNPYTQPPKDSFVEFAVKVTLSVSYATKKRGVLDDQSSSADAQTMLVFAQPPTPITEIDYIAIAILCSVGGAVIIIAIIVILVNRKVIFEKLEDRHATAKKLTSELVKKFQSTSNELQLISTLPDWVAPWQIPISNKDIAKYEKSLRDKIKEEKGKGRTPGTNIKIENIFRIAEWILVRQKKFREENEHSSSSSSSEDKKKRSKKIFQKIFQERRWIKKKCNWFQRNKIRRRRNKRNWRIKKKCNWVQRNKINRR